MIVHPIKPIFDENSEILILGSFPSVKSREDMFFYSHPQNRFWKMLSGILNIELPQSIEEKIEILLKNKIALWDVIGSCEIVGSADSTITNVVPNNINNIVNNSKIKLIVLNGKISEKYFNKFIKNSIDISSICLPSTSPANATYSLDMLINEWKIILKYL